MMRGRLTYSSGNESNPGNPFGRNKLVLDSEGAARLDHYPSRGGSPAAWTGQIEGATLERIGAALELAKFPAMPRHPVPAGATFRTLVLEPAGAAPQETRIEWDAGEKLPGYKDAFALLDAIVAQLGAGVVGGVRAGSDKLVSNVQRVAAK
jgi:hypothetical protein